MKKMTLEQFKEQFNIKLNNQQLKAVPVSYTHLDVYKRQIQYLASYIIQV